MARKALIANDDLLARLALTFRDVGYDSASLALLADATGLKKASLYHRFPGGKEQMGTEVLQQAGRWLAEHILEPLAGTATPQKRIEAMSRQLDDFYQGGKQACLLNLLSSPVGREGPFKAAIKEMLEVFVAALADVVAETGAPPKLARERAERAVALIQGSLVLSRGFDSTKPFRTMLKALPDELLAGMPHR